MLFMLCFHIGQRLIPFHLSCQRFLSLDLKSTLASLPPPELKCLVPGGKRKAFSMRCFQSWHSSWTAQSSTLIHHPSCQPPTESAFSHPRVFGGSHNKSASFSAKEALSRSLLAAVSNSDSLLLFFREKY